MPLNVEMGSQKLLQEWCRLQCENYPNVEIKDLTTSFKDGLAFCAIIHKHRPDLLDFQSLSKDRGYENNCLAFEVAETHLGIPAVLDPADMVSVDVPDRLSVITYLSQYFIYFAKPSDAGYSSLLMPGLPNTCKAGRKGLLISEAVHLPKVKVTNTSGEEVKDQTNSTAPAHLCNACQQCVHLVQRHLVDGKLYHRSCFRCSQCSSTLFPGSYRTDSETGSLLCSNLCLQKPNGLPKLQGPADPEEGPQEAKTQDVPSASSSLVEKHALETTEEEGSENQPPENKSGQIVRDEQCSKNSEEHNNAKSSPAKQTGEVEVKEKRETLEKEKITDMDNDTKRSGVSAGTGSSPTLAKKPGTNSRPVPAPRRAKAQPQPPSTSNPPWPPPRARPAKPMDRSKSEDHTNKTTSKPGEESPSLSRSSEQGGESQKPKSAPWMDLIHPGPWNKLPPVPLPRHPSRSSSVPFLSEMWSRQKSVHLSPGNPFDEDDTCEDLQVSHSGTWTACPEGDESRNTQSAVVMTSHPRCCTDEPGQVTDNKTSKADSPQPAQCADTAPARKGESISVKRGAVCSVEASNCLFAKANTQTSVVKTEMRAEADGKGNGAQPTRPAGVSDLAETAGSVCLLKLAEEVTVLEASRLDSSAGRSELESLPKSALASLPQTISEADICQEQDPPTCVSELQLPTQQRNPPSRTSSSLSGSFSDLNIKQHSNSTRLLASDGPLTNKKPEVPIKPKFDKRICKENPFNRAASLAEIPSASSTYSTKAAAPGHGFPLIKRKVQSDQYTLGKDLQTERGELNRRLDGLEQKGVELEKSLRDCHNEKEDDLLVNWFTLIHEKHMLVRRDAELVYLAKQQSLEERQSDVEYQLRCLFNKPEKEWSQDDKAKEKQLMEDLVTLIEQRNQIINSLDQDRQREQEEDMLLEDMMKRRDFQRPSGQDQKIFSGKFKPMKILKQLSHKTESKKGKTKTSLKKKS